MAGPDRCFWGILPPELVARIVHFLSPNEVACTCRLINKAIANQFNGLISTRLSQPVPHHAFVRRWGDERGIHGLTLARRQQLLCLTARSGVIANLEVAVAAVGCGLREEIFDAAAEGGHLVVCVWLQDRGCPCHYAKVIRRAVSAGHTEVVRWALARSPEVAGDALDAAAGAGQRALCEEILPLVLAAGPARAISTAACEAADGGHVELTEWLGQLADPAHITDGELFRSAARSFELPALQRLYHSQMCSETSLLAEFIEDYGAVLAAAVLTSLTPDWRAKLEWVEAVGCQLGQLQDGPWDDITKHWDAVERLTLLRERDLLDANECLIQAVNNSNLTVVKYLRSEGLLTGAPGIRAVDRATVRAMEVGDLAILVELLEAGGFVWPSGVYSAALRGHLHLFRWLEGPKAGLQAAARLEWALQDAKLAENGARSGSLELMEWLWERGCPSNERVIAAAAEAGNGALLERLVARGCPMSCDAYLEAGYNDDLATLRCLRRLDCPWGPDCTTFDRAVYGGRYCSLAVLRWLVAEGCPVDWQSARALMQPRLRVGDADMVAWIESHLPQA